MWKFFNAPQIWKLLVTTEAHNFHSSSCNCSCYLSERVILRELIIVTKCLFLDTVKIQTSCSQWEPTVAAFSHKCTFPVLRRKILEVWLLVRLASKIWPHIFFLELICFKILPEWHWKPHVFESIRLSSKYGCFNKLKAGWKEWLWALKKESSYSPGNHAFRSCMSWIKISLFRDIIKSPTEIPLQNPWKIHDITTTASPLLAISLHCTLDNGHLTHTAIPDDITLSSC